MIGYGDSATTHDFFAYNSAGAVWNGASFATWADGSYATYRITATQAGTSGRFTGTAPAGMIYYELRVRGASLALSYVVWAESSINAATAATQATTAATEIAKVPRAATALSGGDDFAWNAVTDTATKLTLNITDEEA